MEHCAGNQCGGKTPLDELIDHIEIGERTVVDGHRRQDIKVFYRFVGLVE